MPIELTENVYWVGVVDWGLRHFHGHELSTHRGSSYNSYLIKDRKTVLVDTVWTPFSQEFIEHLRQVVDPSTIDIVVANHSEPDHAGALPDLLRLCPNATVVVSKRGMDSFPGQYHGKWNFKPVGTGDRIDIGSCELVFVEAPMLHWPDSMFTYVTGKNILMPNDAFGQHYATTARFNDEVDQDELYYEALKYYANIIAPFSEQVLRKIDEVLALKLPVDIIAPSHGVLWRKDPLQIVTKYQEFARQTPQKQAVVLYDSMWEATRKMAQAVADGLLEKGVPAVLRHLAISDRNDVLTDIFQAKGLAFGSSTINRTILPSLLPILEDLKGLKFKNKVGCAFGSYGWSGECVKVIEERLAAAKVPLAASGVLAKWQPTADDLEKCRALGRQLADAVLKD